MNEPPSAGASTMPTLFDLVWAGGPLMWPLAACSVVALASITERALRLSRRSLLGPRRFRDELCAAAASGGAAAASTLCLERPSALSRTLHAGLVRAHEGPEALEHAVEEAGAREVSRLNASLRPLMAIAMISPLLGLLGTVWGMIEAFSNLASEGAGAAAARPERLAGGISQALVTTAAGLAIAIPAHAAHSWFKSRIDRFARAIEDAFDALVAALYPGPLRASEPADPAQRRARAASREPAAARDGEAAHAHP